MTDRPDASDRHRSADEPSQTNGVLSRRGVLATLGGLGIAGVGAAAVDARRGAAPAPDVVRSRDAWSVEIDGDRALQLGPATRFEVTDEAFTAGGNVRFGHLNRVADGVAGAVIGGGGLYEHADDEAKRNVVRSHLGTIGGGFANSAGAEESPDEGTAATVGGGLDNLASGTASTVAGGARNDAEGLRSAIGGGINNEAYGIAGTVGGGIGNYANARFAAVAGGGGNTATAEYASVGGGRGNHATYQSARIGGGHKNAARAGAATIAGGYYNKAKAYGAVVPGGAANVADGEYSFAAGYHAETDGHDGAYVFADSSDEHFHADADDAAFFQMPVHARAFNTTSTRTAKTGFEPVDPEEVLESVADLDVHTWRFEDGDGGRHMGPTAEDFRTAFGLGDNADSIATVDADGVALAAIQGLAAQLDLAADRVETLEDELEDRDDRIDELEARLEAVEDAVEDASSAEAAQASP